MSDRSEKIVTLAREILRNDPPVVVPPPRAALPLTVSFKFFCAMTILAALSGSAITHWATERHRPINRYERTELEALIFYAARQKGLDERNLRQEAGKKINAVNFEEMTLRDFETVRQFLREKAR